MKRTPRQLELRVRTWGGRRRGAGRKPAAGRRSTPHRRRPTHDPRCPVHVTLRTRSGLPTLRSDLVFSAVQRALARSSHASFHLLHYSVQSDHLHLLVEADTPTRLARGAQGLAIRVARDQSRRPATRARLARAVSRARAPGAAGSPQRVRLRATEFPEASPCGSRNRSAVVGALVRGMAQRRCGALDRRAGRRPSHLARADRMAATWAARRYGHAAEALTKRKRLPALAHFAHAVFAALVLTHAAA